MTEKIKFIHSADLHLDSPFKGMSTLPKNFYQELKSSTFTALNNLVELAIDEAVDFVLIVGDLFDQSLRSVYAEMQFLLACKKLAEACIPVYLSHGNHDYLTGRTRTLTFPDNLHVFESDRVECKVFKKNSQALVGIHGFSYAEQAVLEDKVPEFEPIDGVPYQIGMLHGSTGQSSEHDTYAPFQLSDLRAKAIDYWALGHIHKREVLGTEPAIVYPGNTQGRSSKELGEKGCYLVEMDQTDTKLTFKRLHEIQFEQVLIDLDGYEHSDQVYQKLQTDLSELADRKSIVFIEFTNASAQIVESYHQGDLEEVIELHNEQQEGEPFWTWIQAVKVEQKRESIESLLNTRDPFMKQLVNQFDQIDFEEAASALRQHRHAKKFLPVFSEEEQAEMIKEAKELALYQLIGGVHDES